MDPLLEELNAAGGGDDEVELILKLRADSAVPPDVRIVARFGDVATCRVPRRRIVETWASDAVLSAKAPRLIAAEPEPSFDESADVAGDVEPCAPPTGATGRGVVAGFVDWGLDVLHPNFRHPDGSTRLLALWDQGARGAGAPLPYGYGRVHDRAAINAALATADPYRTLGYFPAASDPYGEGTHGTHVCDIAAGNGRAPGSAPGVAPDAELVFVHLATTGNEGQASLGDTCRILEALDFIARMAGERPWVVNLSVGRCGGPHNGLTLVEQGMDQLLQEAPGRAIVQSCGNYYATHGHARGQLHPAERRTLTWRTDAADRTPNELEIWYAGVDELLVELRAPDGELVARAPLGERRDVIAHGRLCGRLHHRRHDPSNGDHHVDIFLWPGAPAGGWRVTLEGTDVVDGRFDAWVERDNACDKCQSSFDAHDADVTGTTGTICNGMRTIAVGAYDARAREHPLASFSSCGPTRDGRQKPDIVACGVRIRAARSASYVGDTNFVTVKSGTSMAAPHVTGTVACMFEVASQPLWIHETRRLLMGSARGANAPPELRARLGSGYLDTSRAVTAARASAATGMSARRLTRQPTRQVAMTRETEYFDGALDDAPSWQVESADDYGRDDQPDDGAHLVERAEAVFHGRDALSASALVEDTFRETFDEIGEAMAESCGPNRLAAMFDALTGRAPEPLVRCGARHFTVIAAPRRRPIASFAPGDIFLRLPAGAPHLAHGGLLVSGEIVMLDDLPARGWDAERGTRGGYAMVIEGGAFPHCAHRPFARRMLDERGQMPPGQLVLRARPAMRVSGAAPRAHSGEAIVDDLSALQYAEQPAPPQAYGGFNLQQGDRDDLLRWGGAVRTAAQGPAAGATPFVEQLQRDLSALGFRAADLLIGTFDLTTEWAVREFQIHAKMSHVAQEAVPPAPPAVMAPRYVDRLSRVANTQQYAGRVSGVANAATRALIQQWLTNRWRCPVVVEAWHVNNAGARTTLRKQNLWQYDEFPHASVRMFVRDFSHYYAPLPGGRNADDLIDAGHYACYSRWGGPSTESRNLVWAEGEMTPERLVGAPLAALSVPQRSTYKAIRAVSEVENNGYFDVINAYDDVYVSQGPYHWPIGNVADQHGDLGAYLSFLRHADAAAFDTAIGFFGVRPTRDWNTAANPNGAGLFVAGQRRHVAWLALETEGAAFRPIATEDEANYFRSWHWFYRFLMAGRTIQGYQRRMWDHARRRVRNILETPWGAATVPNVPCAGGGTRAPTIGDVYTSERAVALITRWHVRCPAHIVSGGTAGAKLRSAFVRAGIPPAAGNPSAWTDAHEAQLLTGIIDEVRHLVAGDCGKSGLLETMTTVRDWPRWAAAGAANPWRYTLAPAIGRLDAARNSFHPEFGGVPTSAAPPACPAPAGVGGGGGAGHGEAWSADEQAEQVDDVIGDDTEAAAVTRITVRNRLLRWDGIAACEVELVVPGVATPLLARTNGSGQARIDLSGVSDGTYTLQVRPPNAFTDPVGPATAAATPRPARMWRPLTANVTVAGERITASTDARVSPSGAALTIQVQPVWIASPNESARRGGAAAVTGIIVHHTAGPVIGPALNTIVNTTEQRSAHYFIDTDGEIVKAVHEDRASWHAGVAHWAGRDDVNDTTVGIEIVNERGAYPAAQYDALIGLLERIRAAYPSIAASSIVGHSDIATCPSPGSGGACENPPRRLGRKNGDPGLEFEWERLEARGLGIVVPASAPLGATAYGGFFTAVPGGRLQPGDRDAGHRYGGAPRPAITVDVIKELQGDLRAIGYFCPDTGQYDVPTTSAVRTFQEHFFAGTRPRATHTASVDAVTAERIKAVRPAPLATAPTPAKTTGEEIEEAMVEYDDEQWESEAWSAPADESDDAFVNPAWRQQHGDDASGVMTESAPRTLPSPPASPGERLALYHAMAKLPITGKRVRVTKTLNASTGAMEVVATAEGTGARVDFAALREKERQARAARFGKLHPTLYREMQRHRPSDEIAIAVWAKAEEPDVDKGELMTPRREAPLVAMNESSEAANIGRGQPPAPLLAYRRVVTEARTRLRREMEQRLRIPVSRELQTVPLLVTTATREQIRAIGQLEDVDAIYLYDERGINDLQNSMTDARADRAVDTMGWRGTNIRVAVWEPGPDDLSQLQIAEHFDPARPQKSNHSRLTTAIIKNRQTTGPQGYAPDCLIYSANDYTLEALEWAVVTKECTVVSQSFHRDAEQTDGMLSLDDRVKDHLAVHYPFPIIVQAAGNSSTPGTEYVNHKGFNSLTVGNHLDGAAQIDNQSVFRNPTSVHNDRELPEITANGDSVTAAGRTDSGTSFAAPAVAGTAALLQNANNSLIHWPEGTRAILLAAAGRNLEGSTWWQDVRTGVDAKDGAGVLDAAEAVRIARSRRARNDAATLRGFDIGTLRPSEFDAMGRATFVYRVQVPASGARHVKVALAWDSITTHQEEWLWLDRAATSELTVDHDLLVLEGTRVVAASVSYDNSYEIADFDGTAGTSYDIVIRRSLVSPGDRIWYGIAWTVH